MRLQTAQFFHQQSSLLVTKNCPVCSHVYFLVFIEHGPDFLFELPFEVAHPWIIVRDDISWLWWRFFWQMDFAIIVVNAVRINQDAH